MVQKVKVRECKCNGCEKKDICYYINIQQIVGSFSGYFCLDCCFEMGLVEESKE